MNMCTMALGQQSYIEQIVACFKLDDTCTAVTPMEPGADYTPDSPSVSPTLLTASEKTTYRKMIRSLMYVTVMTCPDITFAVSTLSQYLDAPWSTHLIAVKHVFQYLNGTKELKLVISGTIDKLVGYSDADWGSHFHQHLISGFTCLIGYGSVSWSMKKQPIITLSSTESEYVALMHAAKDIIWIHKLLNDLTFFFHLSPPTNLHCNNQGAIRLSKDSTFHGRTKHINIHFHFMCQTVSSGHIKLHYCPTNEMVTDIFTKSLACVKFEKFCTLLGIT